MNLKNHKTQEPPSPNKPNRHDIGFGLGACGVCEQSQAPMVGFDQDLGTICRDCEPHLLSALNVMWKTLKRS